LVREGARAILQAALEYDFWNKRDLSQKQDVPVWADGICTKIRGEGEANVKPCLLVLMGRRPTAKRN
jgi:hypothetical protein